MFINEDEVTCLHEDPLVITLRVGLSNVYQILVDTRSPVDLLFYPLYIHWELERVM